jgi:allantoin racemase
MSGPVAPRALVINPNRSTAVTEAIRDALAASAWDPWTFRVEQIDEGPETIEGYRDEAVAAPLVVDRVTRRQAEFEAFVIACHGDPGLLAAREACPKPVVGIGEASMLAACGLGHRFGLITLRRSLVAKKWRQLREYGLVERCAAVEPTETGVLHGTDNPGDVGPYVSAGARALEQGAEVLVLGCAGMALARRAVEDELGVRVVEPVAAALSLLRA